MKPSSQASDNNIARVITNRTVIVIGTTAAASLSPNRCMEINTNCPDGPLDTM